MSSNNPTDQDPENLTPEGSESEGDEVDQSNDSDAIGEDDGDEDTDTGEMVEGDELEDPDETAYWEVMRESGQRVWSSTSFVV